METKNSREVYLDNNATTQPLPEVRELMLDVLGQSFGNPSSAHAAGTRACEYMHGAREALATLLGTDPGSLLFTSSGTEANNLVLTSVLRHPNPAPRIVTTQVEHSSVLKCCDYLSICGAEVVLLPVNRHGHLSMSDVEAAITPGTTLVSIQWVNNETGVIYPIEHIGALCQSRGVMFHTDAAQAVGKLPIDTATLPIDFLSLTAHKFHGPQGVGALYAHDRRWLTPMVYGGPQEHGLRAGTENIPGIVGMGKAAELRSNRFDSVQAHLRMLRDYFERLVLDIVPDVEINGDTEQRVCNTTNLLFHGIDGQALVAQLDQQEIRCSQSSACTNQHPEPSYVLRAMGLSEDDAYASVRFSVAESNTLEEVERAAHQIRDICERLRAFSTAMRRPQHPEEIA